MVQAGCNLDRFNPGLIRIAAYDHEVLFSGMKVSEVTTLTNLPPDASEGPDYYIPGAVVPTLPRELTSCERDLVTSNLLATPETPPAHTLELVRIAHVLGDLATSPHPEATKRREVTLAKKLGKV